MDAWIWGAVSLAILLILAGGLAWLLAHGSLPTVVGGVGAIIGGVISLVSLAVLLDPVTGLRVAAVISAAAGAWLLAWVIAGTARAQRAARKD